MYETIFCDICSRNIYSCVQIIEAERMKHKDKIINGNIASDMERFYLPIDHLNKELKLSSCCSATITTRIDNTFSIYGLEPI